MLTFLDADDYWEPHKLKRQLDVLHCHPEVGVVAGRYFNQEPGKPRTVACVEDAQWFDRVLRPRGEFRFVTDWPDYAEWTLERLIRSPHFQWTAERADDWREPWPGFSATRYEAKAKRAGRAPRYLRFRRVA